MAKKLTEEELETLHKKVLKRKQDILHEVLAKISSAGTFGHPDKMHAVLDASDKEDAALNRVGATVGELMRQKALEAKRRALKISDD